MCRNIKALFNFDPPATDEEIHDASLQFVRKLSGFNKQSFSSSKPSLVNEEAYDLAVKEVSVVTRKLIKSLKTNAEPKNREEEHRKAHERAVKRFGIS